MDKTAEIEEIVWRVDSKIAEVRRTSNCTKKNLRFDYDAMGNRIAKHIYTDNAFTLLEKSTFYVRDASGNVMAVYDRILDASEETGEFMLSERHIYGSSRIGMDVSTHVFGPDPYTALTETTRELGHKQYEISNHLGNVLSVITDQKLPVEVDSLIVSYSAVVVTATDYSPFGVGLYGRSWSGEYRYGFNGKENQNETTTSSYDFGARVLNPKLGKWLSVDPLILEYPSTSPYSYVNNQPIVAIDPDGKKILFVNGYWCPGWCGDAVGSKEPGKGYWGAGFTEAAQRFFSDYSLISGANYIDGSSTVGFDEDGEDRYEKGRDYAKNNLETITSGMVEGETIKIVSHSEGCAMAAGITSYLIESGYKVEIVVYLSSDESSDFKAPAEPTSLQLAYCDDAVTVEETISGVDKHGVVYDSDLEAKYHHGQTKSSGVFELLKDLKTVGVTEYLTMCPQDKNAHIIPAQTPETAPNGTVFSEINGRQLFDLETCEPIDQ